MFLGNSGPRRTKGIRMCCKKRGKESENDKGGAGGGEFRSMPGKSEWKTMRRWHLREIPTRT